MEYDKSVENDPQHVRVGKSTTNDRVESVFRGTGRRYKIFAKVCLETEQQALDVELVAQALLLTRGVSRTKLVSTKSQTQKKFEVFLCPPRVAEIAVRDAALELHDKGIVTIVCCPKSEIENEHTEISFGCMQSRDLGCECERSKSET
jgi:hypothetical protein